MNLSVGHNTWKAGSPEAKQQPAQCTACQHCGEVCSGAWPAGAHDSRSAAQPGRR